MESFQGFLTLCTVYWIIGCVLSFKNWDSIAEFLSERAEENFEFRAVIQRVPNGVQWMQFFMFFFASLSLPAVYAYVGTIGKISGWLYGPYKVKIFYN